MLLYHLTVKLWVTPDLIDVDHCTEPSNPLNNSSAGTVCLDVVCRGTATGWHQTKKMRSTFDLQIIFFFSV